MKKLLLAISVVVAACSPATEAPVVSTPAEASTAPASTSQSPAESRLGVSASALRGLSVEVWHPWYGVESDLFDSLIEEFNETNPWEIKVHAESQINFSYLFERVSAVLATAGRPDVVVALPEHAVNWHEQGHVVDLKPYVEDPLYGTAYRDFPIVFWNQDSVRGHRLGLPAQRSSRFLLWNESWAAELGFESPPTTTEDFQAQVCAANRFMRTDGTPENDGRGGWLIASDSMTAYGWLLAFQGAVLEGGDYRFLAPNNIEAFEFLKELRRSDCAWQAAGADAAPTAFATREALVVSAGMEDLPAQSRAMAQEGNADVWHPIAFPGDAVTPVYGSSYMLLRSAAPQQLASWLFIRWLTETDQDARFVEATHLYPLRTATVDLLSAYEKSHPQWGEAIKLLPAGHLQPQLASWRTIKVMLEDGFTCLMGDVPACEQPPVVLAQMESASRELSD